MDGWIKVSRGLFKHFLWKEKRIYSKFEAWLDIVKSARYSKGGTKELIGGKLIKWGYGELPASDSFLMKRWKWSKSKVRNYLLLLTDEEMAITLKDQGQTIIKLCNYEKYNGNDLKKDHQQDQRETSERPARDRNSNRRSNKRKESNIYIPISNSWNEIGFKKCRGITDKHKSAINGIISDKFTEKEIEDSIKLYGEIVNSEKTYYTHKFNLLDFLKQSNGCRRFIQATFEEYLTKKTSTNNNYNPRVTKEELIKQMEIKLT